MKLMTALLGVFAMAFTNVEAAKIPVNNNNPGLVLVYSEKMIDMKHEHIILDKQLMEKVNNTVIKDLSVELPSIFFSRLNVHLSGISLKDLSRPDSRIGVTEKDGILWTVWLDKVSLEGEYLLNYTIDTWVSNSSRGQFLIELGKIEISMQRHLKSSDDKRKLIWSSSDANVIVKDVIVKLSDDYANRMVALVDSNQINKLVVDWLSDPAVYEVLTRYEIDLSYRLTDKVYLDTTPLRDPAIRGGNVQMELKGEVRHLNSKKRYPGVARKMDIVPVNDTVSLAISDYMLGSLAYVIDDQQLLASKYGPEDLLPDEEDFLNMKCEKKRLCVGNVCPKAKALYPDATMQIKTSTRKPPIFELKSSGIVSSLELFIQADAIHKDKPPTKLFVVKLSLKAPISPRIRARNILFEARNVTNNIKVEESKIGNISDSLCLRVIIEHVVRRLLVPVLKKVGIDGENLMLPENFYVDSYKVDRKDGYFDVLMDVRQSKDEIPKFSEELNLDD